MDQSFTATSLYYKHNRHFLIKTHADNILHTIKQDIVDAVKNGLTYCDFSPPEYFNIQEMKNADAQLLIYTRVIGELDNRGFETKIDRKNNKWRISGWDLNVTHETQDKLYDYYLSKCVNDLDK